MGEPSALLDGGGETNSISPMPHNAQNDIFGQLAMRVRSHSTSHPLSTSSTGNADTRANGREQRKVCISYSISI